MKVWHLLSVYLVLLMAGSTKPALGKTEYFAVFMEGKKVGHASVRVYIGWNPASREPGKWVGLDAAFKSAGLHGYGPGHIALAVGGGEPADFFNLVTTLGQFKIDKVVVNKG